MGVFMASVAFRRNTDINWMTIKAEIYAMLAGTDGLTHNLDQDRTGYAIVSPYGDMAPFLSRLPEKISRLTGSYAVMVDCVDSDFSLVELYHNGELLQRCFLGEPYGEIAEFAMADVPEMELWKPLLLDKSKTDQLHEVLFGQEIFAEVQLRKLSALTGLPIFDDELVFGELT